MRINSHTLPLIAARAKAGRVVAFDTETTGGTAWDEICQIAAAEFIDGTLARTMAVYVRPMCPMNPWAEAIYVNSHDALDDALACAGAFFKLLEGRP